MNKTVYILIVIALVIGAVAGALLFKGETNSLGSVTVGNDYYATSTPWDVAQADGQIVRGHGNLGSVVVTSAGDLNFRIYDATSTQVAHFTENGKTTSTAELARINTATAGTYVFDVSFNEGLYLDVTSGTNGTTTVTYR